ncbi:MAG: carboxypeptidase-like regulatory domain-containing protein [Planctomycetota bacterium]|nr:carboxypeptidase-like regulatory domain-containing protein [Planctomycetota bacterium]
MSKLALGAVLFGVGAWLLWPQTSGSGARSVEGGEPPAAAPAVAAARADPLELPNPIEAAEGRDASERETADTKGITVVDLNGFVDATPPLRFPPLWDYGTVEPGTIEGLASHRGVPVERGTVWYGLSETLGVPADPAEPMGTLNHGAMKACALRADGTFRIQGLADGMYWLGVDTGRGVEVQSICGVSANSRGHRLEFRLGDARIEGRVYDPQGQPVAGTEIRLEPFARLGQFWIATSSADGSYAIRGLPAGGFEAHAIRPGDRRAEEQSPSLRYIMDLGEAETRTVDFGTPPPNTRWTGRILDSAGEHVEVDGRLDFLCEPWCAHPGESASVVLKRGRFDMRVAPGTHPLAVVCDSSSVGAPGHVSLGRFQPRIVPEAIGTEDLQRDLVLPGSTVRGHFAGIVAMRDPGLVSASLESSERFYVSAKVRDDGSFRAYALEPGEWTVRVRSEGRTVGEVAFTVLEGELVVNVWVPLEPR